MQANYRLDMMPRIDTGTRDLGRGLFASKHKRDGNDGPATRPDPATLIVESYDSTGPKDCSWFATSFSISMRLARQWTAGSPSTFLVCEQSRSEKRGRLAGVG